MRDFSLANRNKQSGAILVIALLFLVTITLLTVASMRSSNIGLQMVQNEESQVLHKQALTCASQYKNTPTVDSVNKSQFV